MNVGIIGLPQSGKKTLFRLLVGEKALDGNVDSRSPVRGVAVVNGTKIIYDPLGMHSGNDWFEAQLGDKAEHIMRFEVVVGQPEVASGDIYTKLGEQLF